EAASGSGHKEVSLVERLTHNQRSRETKGGRGVCWLRSCLYRCEKDSQVASRSVSAAGSAFDQHTRRGLFVIDELVSMAAPSRRPWIRFDAEHLPSHEFAGRWPG